MWRRIDVQSEYGERSTFIVELENNYTKEKGEVR